MEEGELMGIYLSIAGSVSLPPSSSLSLLPSLSAFARSQIYSFSTKNLSPDMGQPSYSCTAQGISTIMRSEDAGPPTLSYLSRNGLSAALGHLETGLLSAAGYLSRLLKGWI